MAPELQQRVKVHPFRWKAKPGEFLQLIREISSNTSKSFKVFYSSGLKVRIPQHPQYFFQWYLSKHFAERQYTTAWTSAWKDKFHLLFVLVFNYLTSSAMAEMTKFQMCIFKNSDLFFVSTKALAPYLRRTWNKWFRKKTPQKSRFLLSINSLFLWKGLLCVWIIHLL